MRRAEVPVRTSGAARRVRTRPDGARQLDRAPTVATSPQIGSIPTVLAAVARKSAALTRARDQRTGQHRGGSPTRFAAGGRPRPGDRRRRCALKLSPPSVRSEGDVAVVRGHVVPRDERARTPWVGTRCIVARGASAAAVRRPRRCSRSRFEPAPWSHDLPRARPLFGAAEAPPPFDGVATPDYPRRAGVAGRGRFAGHAHLRCRTARRRHSERRRSQAPALGCVVTTLAGRHRPPVVARSSLVRS